MKFIFQGDFNFPASVVDYFNKHFYLWSFQGGALNFDGIMRIFIRIPNILVFYLSNNLAASYFYLASILIFSFFSFYFFAKYFYQIKNRGFLIVSSFLFVLNPAFLGNIAKTGLILAVSVLPLLLLFIKLFFEKKDFRYLVIASILLNISIIHPFTFAVNVLACLIYFMSKAIPNKAYLLRDGWKLLLVIVLAFLLNVYFILPIVTIGTLDKSSLSSETEEGGTDYTMMVSVANADNILTAFSFSKNKLKDFEFYDDSSKNIYFSSVFLIYVLILGIFLARQKKMDVAERRSFVMNLAIFLFLILLSTGTFLSIDRVIKFLISLPGGWSFRSPLKWQLYLPLFFCSMFLIVSRSMEGKKIERYILAGLAVCIIGSASFVSRDIFSKLLVPKEIKYWSFLEETKRGSSKLLFINEEQCRFFTDEDDRARQELNQMLLAKNIYVKNVDLESLYSADIRNFDYVITCGDADAIKDAFIRYNSQGNVDTRSWYAAENGNISWLEKINNGMEDVSIYENTKESGALQSFDSLFSLNPSVSLDKKYSFIAEHLHKYPYFIDNENVSSGNAQAIRGLFENSEYKNLDIKNQAILDAVPGNSDEKYKLYIKGGNEDFKKNIYLNGEHVAEGPIDLRDGENTFEYKDPELSFENVIQNSSFQNGTWQEKVGDCYNYDRKPILKMNLSTTEKTDGAQSLQLEATRHIACTSAALSVSGGNQYLFSFDYQSPNADKAAYYFSFNDKDNTVIREVLPIDDADWHTFSGNITAPEGATEASLYVYAYSTDENTNIINRYDNFKMIKTLDLSGVYYLTSENNIEFKNPSSVSYDTANPTKKLVHIKGATTPFYLALSESYHPQWQLQLANEKVNGFFNSWLPFVKPDKVSEESHYKLNDFMNGWLVDPETLCANNNIACLKNADGSYDLEMTAEFFPQRWFYFGLLISGITFFGSIMFLVFSFWRRKNIK